MANFFSDHRGEIRDVHLGKIDCVTYVTFTEGAVRGNHYHKRTDQHDYIVEGELIVATQKDTWIVGPGDIITHKRGMPHAYKALTPAKMICMVRGIRKGEDYAKDTYKVDKPLL